MYAVDRYEQWAKDIQTKPAILASNLSLLEKQKALEEAGLPFLLSEILQSHPLDWSMEDEITRKVWMGHKGT